MKDYKNLRIHCSYRRLILVTMLLLPAVVTAESMVYRFNKPIYHKVSASGELLPKSATSWSCVFDAANENLWEIKPDQEAATDNALQALDTTFRWGGSDGAMSIENIGRPQKVAKQMQWTLKANRQWQPVGVLFDDWAALVERLRAESYCGFATWQVPSVLDLMSLSSFYYQGRGEYSRRWSVDSYADFVYVDVNYFRDLKRMDFPFYWSNTPSSSMSLGAWQVFYGDGKAFISNERSSPAAVRLVINGLSKDDFSSLKR